MLEIERKRLIAQMASRIVAGQQRHWDIENPAQRQRLGDAAVLLAEQIVISLKL